MHYTCTKCKYEFDVEIISHPHPINSGSIDLKQSVMKVEEKKDAKN